MGGVLHDLLGLDLSFHVFTVDGDFNVSDSAAGDQMLASVVTQYPDATVIPEDRRSGDPLAEAMPLLRLLQETRGYVALDGQSLRTLLTKGDGEGAR
jgi:hypothetical protein